MEIKKIWFTNLNIYVLTKGTVYLNLGNYCPKTRNKEIPVFFREMRCLGDLIQVLNFICTKMSILIFIFYTQGVVHPVKQIHSNMCQSFWLKFAYMEAHAVLII